MELTYEAKNICPKYTRWSVQPNRAQTLHSTKTIENFQNQQKHHLFQCPFKPFKLTRTPDLLAHPMYANAHNCLGTTLHWLGDET